MKNLAELKANATYSSDLILGLCAKQVDLAFAIEVRAIFVEDGIDRRRRDAAKDQRLTVELGVAVEEPRPHTGIVHVVTLLRL